MGALTCCGACGVKPRTAKWLYFGGAHTTLRLSFPLLICDTFFSFLAPAALRFTLTAILTWVLRDYSDDIFKHIRGLDNCLNLANSSGGGGIFDTGGCVGKGAVLRISFGNFIFFGAHAVALLGVKRADDARLGFHTHFWPLQVLVWAALVFVCFLMPNSVFSAYGQVAKVGGGVFLILVILIIVDWVYLLNEWLLERDDQAARIGLIAGSTACYVGATIGIGFLYHYFAPAASCGLNIAWITLTLIFAVIYTAISLSPWRSPSAGLLTSGVVYVYSTYLVWAALTSEPYSSCSAVSSTKALQITGFFVAIITVLATCLDAGLQGKAFIRGDIERLEEGGEAAEASKADELPYRVDWFHACFMLASCYIAMVFTGWDLNDGPNPWTVDKGWFSSWVKIVSQWLCALVYTWTLIAATVLQRWRRF